MSTLLCDYPNVVEPELLAYMQKQFPSLEIQVCATPTRFQFIPCNAYLAGADNFRDFQESSIIFVRRSLNDFFVRHVERLALSEKLGAPFWASAFDEKLRWLFDCKEQLLRSIVSYWMDRESVTLPIGSTVLHRTNYGKAKPIELFQGSSLTPATPKVLPDEYSQALLTIAQSL